MEEGLIQKLLATSGVTALVSQRVYPGSMPQASPLPSIVMNRVSGAPLYTDQGECGLASARVQIDCWAQTYTGAKQVARAVITSLSAFAGTSSGFTFQYVMVDDERDFREGGSNSNEYLFRTSIDLIVWFEN
jgi:hypothetical protein